MRLIHSRLAFGAALGFILACGGSSSSSDVTAAVVAPPVVEAPPKPLFADTKWDLIWTNEDAGTDHLSFNADGSVTDFANNDKVKGTWSAEGREFKLVWQKWIYYEGVLSEDGSNISGTWKKDNQKGTWRATPTTFVPKAPKPAAASSGGSSLPSCSDLKSKCRDKSDSRSRDCWSSCSGNSSCQDACNKTNLAERVDCEYVKDCR